MGWIYYYIRGKFGQFYLEVVLDFLIGSSSLFTFEIKCTKTKDVVRLPIGVQLCQKLVTKNPQAQFQIPDNRTIIYRVVSKISIRSDVRTFELLGN